MPNISIKDNIYLANVVVILLSLSLLICGSVSCYDLVSSVVGTAHAANLPPSIVVGTYISVDDTLLTAGTTLNVPDMLTHAASNSATEAVCTLLRTTFKGTLTITLPTTAAAWTTSNVPLRLLIEDGVSGSSRPSTYLSVTGVLSLGSTIIVKGGDYSIESRFIFFQTAVTIQDSSTFSMKGGTYRALLSASTITSLLYSTGTLTISDSSALTMDDNNMIVADVTVTTSTYWYVVYLSYTNMITNSGSTFSISNNIISISNINVVTTWRTAMLRGLEGTVEINTAGNLTINNNDVTITDVNMVDASTYWYTLYLDQSPVDIKGSSLVTVSQNEITVTDAVVRGWVMYDCYLDHAGVTMEDGSNVTLSYNKVTMSDSTGTGYFTRGALNGYESPLNIKTASSLAIKYNEYIVFDSTTGSTLEIEYADLELCDTTISTGSTFTISDNTATVSNVDLNSQFRMRILELDDSDVSLSTESAFSISSNTLELEDITVGSSIAVYIVTPSQCGWDILSGSTFSIDNNNVTAANIPVTTTLQSYTVESLDYSDLAVDGTGSTFFISNNLLSISDVSVGTNMMIMTISELEGCDLLVSNGGTITISHNTICTSNLTVIGVFSLYTIYLEEEATFDVGTGSSVIISCNALIVNDLTVDDSWYVYTLFLNAPASPLSVTAGSLFSISNNRMDFTKIDVDKKWECIFLHGIESSVTISDNSNLTIDDNDITVSGVTSRTAWYWYAMSMNDESVKAAISSLLSYSNNVLTATHLEQGYWYVSTIYFDYAGITTDTGSVFTVYNNTVTVSNSNMGTWITRSVYGFESPVRALTNSLMSVNGNFLEVSDSIIGQLTVYELQWEICLPTARSSSNITMSYNTITVTNTNFTTYMSWSLAALQSDAVSVSINSIISFSNNKVILHMVTLGTSISMYTYYPSESNTDVKTGSTLAIDNNNVTASRITIGSYWRSFMVYLRDNAEMTVDGSGSSISISNNVLSMSDATMGSFCFVSTYSVHDAYSSMILLNDGAATISYNTMLWSDVTMTTTWVMYVLNSVDASITINAGSFLTVSNNFISTENGAATSTALNTALIYISSQYLAVNGEMIVGGNTINLQGYTGTIAAPPPMLSVGSQSTISGLGRMSFHHNSVVGGGGSGEGSMMDFTAGTLGPVTPPMRTCRNYVDGQLCTLSAGGVYSCATGSSGLVGNIADCTVSVSRTESQTPTGTGMVTKSESITSTHSLPETASIVITKNTPTNTLPYTASPHPTATNTLPTTATNTPQPTPSPTIVDTPTLHTPTSTPVLVASFSQSKTESKSDDTMTVPITKNTESNTPTISASLVQTTTSTTSPSLLSTMTPSLTINTPTSSHPRTQSSLLTTTPDTTATHSLPPTHSSTMSAPPTSSPTTSHQDTSSHTATPTSDITITISPSPPTTSLSLTSTPSVTITSSSTPGTTTRSSSAPPTSSPTFSSQRTMTRTIPSTSTLTHTLSDLVTSTTTFTLSRNTLTTTLSTAHTATNSATTTMALTSTLSTSKTHTISLSMNTDSIAVTRSPTLSANTPTTTSTPSLPSTVTTSLSRGTPSDTATPTHPPTTTESLSTTTSATYSVSSTIPLPINETCNYTCADTVALQQVTPTTTTTPQQAIDAYLGNISTSTTTGCTAMALPFTATAQGAVTTVLMHLAASKLPLNQSNLLVGMVLSTTKPGAMQASIVAANYTADGGLVVVFDVRRVDASPTNIVSGSVVLPGGNSGPFFCTPTSTLQQSGLPWANIALGAPPPALSEGERTAVAVLAMASADLQTVAAIGMLRCSPGSDEDVESEAGIRALVPVALSGTCAGAVQGALLAIGAAGVLSVVAMCIVRAVKKKDGGGRLGWVDAAAMVRCPGVVIAVWAFVQMGLVVCGARLATSESGGSGDIVLGVVGVLAGAVLPVVCIGLAWGVVSRRCYRLAQVPEAVAGRSRVVVWARSVFLPSYELDAEVYPVSKAFSTVVGRTRRPSCVWAGLPVIQPVVMMFIVFVTGDSCDTFLIVTGVAMMLVGALCHVLFRPHRIVASNYLQGIAMALNAAVLFIASKLVGDPLNVVALDANSMIAMIQVAFSVCRFAHTAIYVVYMRLYRKRALTIASKFPSPPTQISLTSPVLVPEFTVHCTLCGACSGESAVRRSSYNVGMLEVPLVAITSDGGRCGGSRRTSNISSLPELRVDHKNDEDVDELVELPASDSRGAEYNDGTCDSDPTTFQPPQGHTGSVATTKKFVWNPKEYVPMERPYTMLYEEDFTPPDDESLQLMDGDSDQVSLDAEDDLSPPSPSRHQGSGNSFSLLDTSVDGGSSSNILGYRHHSSSSLVDDTVL